MLLNTTVAASAGRAHCSASTTVVAKDVSLLGVTFMSLLFRRYVLNEVEYLSGNHKLVLRPYASTD
jgi:hypothetical protein